ncbi:MAG: HAD-IA family hydrolase [Thermonemataceae bacterium]
MTPKALFIGSIGAVAETSELQRLAYNQAMAEQGLNWEWTPETYRALLRSSGGQDRLRLLSDATHQNLTDEVIQKIHSQKTILACEMIIDQKVTPRPGVVSLIKQAKETGAKVAWVTSTYPANTDAILASSNGALTKDSFDYIFHREEVQEGKPSPEIYQKALQRFGLEASDCIALEDSLISALAAKGAGIFTIVTPGQYHDEHVENIADRVFLSLAQTNWKELVTHYQASLKPIVE